MPRYYTVWASPTYVSCAPAQPSRPLSLMSRSMPMKGGFASAYLCTCTCVCVHVRVRSSVYLWVLCALNVFTCKCMHHARGCVCLCAYMHCACALSLIVCVCRVHSYEKRVNCSVAAYQTGRHACVGLARTVYIHRI
jgi:hypothetical protein